MTINRLSGYTNNKYLKSWRSSVIASEPDGCTISLDSGKHVGWPLKVVCMVRGKGLNEKDNIHKQLGNYLIEVRENDVSNLAYSIVTYPETSSRNAKTRSFVMSNDEHLCSLKSGRRIDEFANHMEQTEGNMTLD